MQYFVLTISRLANGTHLHPVGSTRISDRLKYNFIMVVYEKIFLNSYFGQIILTEFLKNFS